MPAPPLRLLLLVAASCAGLGGCAATGRGTVRVDDLHVELPPAAAAAIASAALRDALRAEPVDVALGPPATSRRDGGFDVVYRRDADGRWLPCARQRLRVWCDGLRAEARVEVRQIAPGDALAATADGAEVHLAFVPRQTGTAVRIELPRTEAGRLEPLLRRTFALATAETEHAPGLAEPNLAAWRAARLLRSGLAVRAEDPERAAELLQCAARLTETPAIVHAELGAAATAQGDTARAARSLRLATLLTEDPCARASLARRAAVAARCDGRPGELRGAAVLHLLDGELAAAETLLHSARRRAPSPAVDYGLLGRVHDQRGDDMAAFAAEVLAREYAASAARPAPLELARWAQLVGIAPALANAMASMPAR